MTKAIVSISLLVVGTSLLTYAFGFAAGVGACCLALFIKP